MHIQIKIIRVTPNMLGKLERSYFTGYLEEIEDEIRKGCGGSRGPRKSLQPLMVSSKGPGTKNES